MTRPGRLARLSNDMLNLARGDNLSIRTIRAATVRERERFLDLRRSVTVAALRRSRLARMLPKILPLPEAVPECFPDAQGFAIQRLDRRPAPGNSTFSRKRGSRSNGEQYRLRPRQEQGTGFERQPRRLGREEQGRGPRLGRRGPSQGRRRARGCQARDMASNLAGQARDAASTAGRRLSDAASYAGDRADDATSSVGGGMKSLASQVRQNAPHEGMLGSAAGYAASALDRTGCLPARPGPQRHGRRLHRLDPSQPHPGPADRRRRRLPDRAGHLVQELISWPTECKPARCPTPPAPSRP